MSQLSHEVHFSPALTRTPQNDKWYAQCNYGSQKCDKTETLTPNYELVWETKIYHVLLSLTTNNILNQLVNTKSTYSFNWMLRCGIANQVKDLFSTIVDFF